ncbi:glutathione S-transferase PARB-like [Momordica charantia]|uniref:glutathione transferase n=1 Tax=Momordica charantia TaxID=3673 RepID=A0A6J1D749_MOMCH|nr:glutathione S-transferase PARB-like [Momordica charantia]
MASSIKVHRIPISTATCRVLACLYEKELQFQFVNVKMHEEEHKKEPFLSLNPFGQIPGFQDGDFSLFESRAITQYISTTYATNGTQLISQDPKKMVAILTWVEVESHHLDQAAMKVIWELCLKPMLGLGEADAAVAEKGEAELGKVLDIYERSCLSPSTWLVSPSLWLTCTISLL